MTTYIIGYDLNKPLQNDTDLIEAIKAYDTWWHHLDSTWIIQTDQTAAQVRDNLARHIDTNDELLVAKISAPAAQRGLTTKARSG